MRTGSAIVLTLILLALAALTGGGPGTATPAVPIEPAPGQAENVNAEVTSSRGVRVTKFSVPEGTIRLNLTDDMAAGDQLSGTVELEPAGATPEARAKNADELSGYVTEAGETKTRTGEGRLRFSIPKTAATIALTLRKRSGEIAARANLRCRPAPASAYLASMKPFARAATRTAADYKLPDVLQAGRPAVVTGPFDGDLGTTSCSLGNERLRPLAESTRSAVFDTPSNVRGAHNFEMNERGVRSTAQARVISIILTATKMNLLGGEIAILKLVVEGLLGLDRDIPVVVQNLTPAVVRTEWGNMHRVIISPADTGGGDVFTRECKLMGVQPGNFSIVAMFAGLFPFKHASEEGPDKSKFVLLTDYHVNDGGAWQSYYVPGDHVHITAENDFKSWYLPGDWKHIFEEDAPLKSWYVPPYMIHYAGEGSLKSSYIEDPNRKKHIEAEGPEKSTYVPYNDTTKHAQAEGPYKSKQVRIDDYHAAQEGRDKSRYVPWDFVHFWRDGPDKSKYGPPDREHADVEGPDKSRYLPPGYKHADAEGSEKSRYVDEDWVHFTMGGPDNSYYVPPGMPHHATEEGPDKSRYLGFAWWHIGSGPDSSRYRGPRWKHFAEGPDASRYYDQGFVHADAEGPEKSCYIPPWWRHVTGGPNGSRYEGSYWGNKKIL